MEQKRSFFKRFWHPIYRTLRIDILTLFLSLFILSFSFVISFGYLKDNQSISLFSLGEMSRASSVIFERVKAFTEDAMHFPTITDSVVWEESDISQDNKNLILYLLHTVQLENDFSTIFVASKEGDFIGANDLRDSGQRTLMTMPSQLLPENARYSLFLVDTSTQPHTNTWIYKDKDFKTIYSEKTQSDAFDPRERPWYKGAMQKGGVYWSDVFTYFATGDKGISVSLPLHDPEGHIFGVSGVELSFSLLARFLSQQVVGKTGQVFLLTSNGEELIAHGTPQDTHAAIPHQAVVEAYRQHMQSHQKTFLFKENGIKYLAYVDTIPIVSGENWLITIIVPHADFFADLIENEKMISLITFSVLLISGIFVFLFSKRISHPIVALSKEVDRIKHLDLSSELRIKSNIKEIMLMDTSIAAMRSGLRSFVRYVPRRIVQQLIEKGEEIKLGGEKKEITILFTDISGFTSFSETHSADSVMHFLAEYFDELSKLILTEEGTIDKYIGDSIMAFWNAPLEISDHALRACSAALRCQAFISRFNQKREHAGESPLHTRIVIHTGTVIVGNIGTNERMNYTVIGDPVNTAAHLHQVNKIYHVKTLITEATFQKTRNRCIARPLDIVVPAGKKTKVKIYELMGMVQGDPIVQATREQQELCTLFEEGFNAFNAEEYKKAQSLFMDIAKKYPDDFPTQFYLERLKNQHSVN